jgi:hypothetical protein
MTAVLLLAVLSLGAAPEAAADASAVAPVAPLGRGPAPVSSVSQVSPGPSPVAAVAPVSPGAAPVQPVTPLAAEHTPSAPAQGPDLELHVPNAEVQKLGLEVENLQARLDLDTSVANLVRIQAGVVATVQKLKVQLEGVRAETHLVVRLDRVTEVMSRALGSIDRHPDLAGEPVAAARVEALPAVSADAAAQPAAVPAKSSQE